MEESFLSKIKKIIEKQTYNLLFSFLGFSGLILIIFGQDWLIYKLAIKSCNIRYITFNILISLGEMICWGMILKGLSFMLFKPIPENSEKRFLSLSGSLFSNIFIYTLSRLVKDALLLLSPLGAQITTAAKVAVLFMSTLYHSLYMYFAPQFHNKYSLLLASGGIIFYFFIYVSFLMGNSSVLPNFTNPNIFTSLLNIWPETVFYLLSEIWSNTVLTVNFWKIANNYLNVEERESMYTIFGVIAQFGALFSGYVFKISGLLLDTSGASTPFYVNTPIENITLNENYNNFENNKIYIENNNINKLKKIQFTNHNNLLENIKNMKDIIFNNNDLNQQINELYENYVLNYQTLDDLTDADSTEYIIKIQDSRVNFNYNDYYNKCENCKNKTNKVYCVECFKKVEKENILNTLNDQLNQIKNSIINHYIKIENEIKSLFVVNNINISKYDKEIKNNINNFIHTNIEQPDYINEVKKIEKNIKSYDYKLIENNKHDLVNICIWFILLASIVLYVSNNIFFTTIEDFAIIEEKESIKVEKAPEPKKSFWSILMDPAKLAIASLTIFYGIVTFAMEQTWKNSVAKNAISVASYADKVSSLMINQSRIVLILSTILAGAFKHCNNYILGLITPIISIVGSVSIFIPRIFQISKVEALDHLNVLSLNLFKASKYIAFDKTREQYIAKYNKSDRVQIKNFEGLISKFGKSGFALVCSLIFLILPDIKYGQPGFSAFLFIVCSSINLIWMGIITFIN